MGRALSIWGDQMISTDSQRGFTLVEVMIVLVIVSIVTAFSYASYQHNIHKVRRTDAQTTLVSFSAAMERHYIAKGSYLDADDGNPADALGFLVPDAAVFESEAPLDGSVKYYDLRISALTATAYTLHAIPKGSQSSDGKMKVGSTGERVWDNANDGSYSSVW